MKSGEIFVLAEPEQQATRNLSQVQMLYGAVESNVVAQSLLGNSEHTTFAKCSGHPLSVRDLFHAPLCPRPLSLVPPPQLPTPVFRRHAHMLPVQAATCSFSPCWLRCSFRGLQD